MTWDDLAKAILEMTDGDREKTVYYREPYDNDAEMFPVNIRETIEDLADPEGAIKVSKGEAYLQ